MTKLQLVRYRGKYWYWRGLKNHRGELLLDSISKDGEGIGTEPRYSYRIVEGEEYNRQMKAIEYFRSIGAAL